MSGIPPYPYGYGAAMPDSAGLGRMQQALATRQAQLDAQATALQQQYDRLVGTVTPSAAPTAPDTRPPLANPYATAFPSSMYGSFPFPGIPPPMAPDAASTAAAMAAMAYAPPPVYPPLPGVPAFYPPLPPLPIPPPLHLQPPVPPPWTTPGLAPAVPAPQVAPPPPQPPAPPQAPSETKDSEAPTERAAAVVAEPAVLETVDFALTAVEDDDAESEPTIEAKTEEATASSAPPNGGPTPPCVHPSERRQLVVKFLTPETSEDDLRQLFARMGPVEHARVITDRLTGQHKGYGFVDYKHSEDAAKAVKKMRGYPLYGKRLKIAFVSNERRDAAGLGTEPSSATTRDSLMTEENTATRETLRSEPLLTKPSSSGAAHAHRGLLALRSDRGPAITTRAPPNVGPRSSSCGSAALPRRTDIHGRRAVHMSADTSSGSGGSSGVSTSPTDVTKPDATTSEAAGHPQLPTGELPSSSGAGGSGGGSSGDSTGSNGKDPTSADQASSSRAGESPRSSGIDDSPASESV